LNLQSNASTSAETISALQESHDRIRSMALIHEQLYNVPDLASIDVAEYVELLLQQLYNTHAKDDLVKVGNEVNHPPMDVETGVPCGLILTELIVNALKHAFPEGRCGTIHASLNQLEDSRSQLCVQDVGVGFSGDTDPQQSTSLDLHLVRLLSGQLGTGIYFETHTGFRVVITFSTN
jgi:two-component sensor histidine kinase